MLYLNHFLPSKWSNPKFARNWSNCGWHCRSHTWQNRSHSNERLLTWVCRSHNMEKPEPQQRTPTDLSPVRDEPDRPFTRETKSSRCNGWVRWTALFQPVLSHALTSILQKRKLAVEKGYRHNSLIKRPFSISLQPLFEWAWTHEPTLTTHTHVPYLNTTSTHTHTHTHIPRTLYSHHHQIQLTTYPTQTNRNTWRTATSTCTHTCA